jgi:hypothetical protein
VFGRTNPWGAAPYEDAKREDDDVVIVSVSTTVRDPSGENSGMIPGLVIYYFIDGKWDRKWT